MRDSIYAAEDGSQCWVADMKLIDILDILHDGAVEMKDDCGCETDIMMRLEIEVLMRAKGWSTTP